MSHGEGGGRPPHEPTDATKYLVKELTAYGITQEKIAQRLGISIPTLTTYYQFELDTGKTDVIQKVAKRLVSRALDDDDQDAMKFYLRTQGGWTDKPKDDDLSKALSLVERMMMDKKSEG